MTEGRAVSQDPVTPSTVGVDPDLMVRPRLLDLLPDEPMSGFTVLRAPAGYGKTVLASRWAALRSVLPARWVNLRAGDDAARVAHRMREGLGDRDGEEPGDGAGSASLAATLSLLRRTLAASGDLVVVVDGLDLPADPTIVTELESWLAALPASVRTVVTRRSRSGWPIERSGLPSLELSSADLAFTPEELRALVRLIAELELDDEQLDALVRRTEGWPVAVNLAATALRANPDLDTVLGRLHGTNPQIAALFSSEVLGPAPETVRRFLMRTSVLDVLDGPLCSWVTGDPEGGRVLRSLERRGAFVDPLTGDPDRFRYLGPFRDHLRAELRASDPSAEAALLHLAVEWHADRGEPERAAHYALEAGLTERVVELVDRFTRPSFERGDPASMLALLDALPNADHPLVAVRRAYLQTMLGETRLASQVLRDAEEHLHDEGVAAAAHALRATWVFFDAVPEASIRAANRALDLLHTSERSRFPDLLGLTAPEQLEAMALGSRARARWCAGELDAAREELLSILERPALYPPWHVHVMSALAVLEAWSGHLRRALGLGRRSVQLADAHGLLQHPATLDAYLAVAHALRERNDLLRSDRLLRSVEARLDRFRRPTTVAMTVAERAAWHLAAGQPERGLDALHDLRVGGEPPPPPTVEDRRRAITARLWLDRGEQERARASLEGDGPGEGSCLAATEVQVAVARGDLDGAAERMSSWTNRPTDLKGELERELWTAIVALERDERRAAVERALAVLLPMAAVEGHRRVFLDAGDPAERLLRAVDRAAPSPQVDELLRGFDSRHAVAGGSTVGLSDRELEILRYLPTDLSSAEIAAQLYISLNTLKTHLRTIYRKLGVGGRRQAIERATQLGIA